MTYQPASYGAVHQLRGHGGKIALAVAALRADGEFPSGLRPVEREKRISNWLRQNGYADSELPSRHAISRYFRFHLQSEQLAPIAQ